MICDRKRMTSAKERVAYARLGVGVGLTAGVAFDRKSVTCAGRPRCVIAGGR